MATLPRRTLLIPEEDMKLYLKSGACSRASHIVLRESGLAFETEVVDLRAKKTADGGDYLAINPKGQVPALALTTGEVLTEGVAIMQYVADLVPGTELVPAAGSFERYRAIEWLNFVASEIHKTVSPLFNPKTPADYRAIALGNLDAKLAIVDRALADKPFLMGDAFGIADAYLFVVLSWSPALGVELAKFPNLVSFVARVGERPSVKAAIAAEAA